MDSVARHIAEVEARRLLYGAPERLRKPAAPHDLLQQVETGAKALASLTSHWRPLLPTLVALAEAEHTAAGIARLLGELRQHCGGGMGA